MIDPKKKEVNTNTQVEDIEKKTPESNEAAREESDEK